ncbi:hypothetical protein DQW77_09530 [Roseovarius sp. TE539]|uniref:hypothetical protein n=1 Tax=Roseovarius sp. TE539 TaxID=2249812 RepID=UPI000DE0AA1D|nr:hypothetical protein [Roseovarius sp. TE539]RBI73149.1 hypothetical protein DQW77_09530 [Roseovarius sp. TE539]
MIEDTEIAMLWVEGPLSYMEQLCAVSFRDAGHKVKLYHYGPVENVPDGVELADGNEILNAGHFLTHGRTGSPALFSDVFRYHLLKKGDGVIWADTDAYCVRPFRTETGHFFGWESEQSINGGVLGMPADSEALGLLLEMTEDEFAIPEWYTDRMRARLHAKAEEGRPVHVSDLPWGVWGPHAITHYLHKTGEAKYALPVHGLYPVPFKHRRKMGFASKRDRISGFLHPDTYSVHFYGRRIKQFLAGQGGTPEEGSYIDALLKKHDVDPAAAPVPPLRERA